MSDAAIVLIFVLIVFGISVISLHCKLDELDDDIKKALGLESRLEKNKWRDRL